MIAIIISACMIADPDVCKDYKIPLMIDVDSRMCLVHAPPHFGKWAAENPGWRIVRWRCGAASDQDI